MKLGFGFYRHMLTDEYCRFAVQCGATHAVVHLCDYGMSDTGGRKDNQPVGDDRGWGAATHPDIWTSEEILDVRALLEKHGLTFYAIENFDPAQWHDVLLDGPRRNEQMDRVKEQIRNVGAAGVPVFGYNFSLGGVAGRIETTTRGGATAVGLTGDNEIINTPIPNGMVWNMIYDEHAPKGSLPPVSRDEFWQRYTDFVEEIVPVAEEAGVVMAAHPDDPPLETVRGQPRLVYRHGHYDDLLKLNDSHHHQLECCVGTLAEMQDDDLYGAIRRYVSTNRIAYVHLRNVRGKAPNYTETFIDDGDIHIGTIAKILNDSGFTGVVIPDHAPQMSCSAPWHAGMAFAMGYLKSTLQNL